ncbi:tetratricopeptide repeat protein [Galbibacter sp. EGI 63066]|uniref:tetratricopeptide repeat protein n=1 Tax=Galbibacter sp. EGI 63066 TaxID=2993559 RepID=UPI002248FC3F|nr:tetratricopeptide repeat protein [Galbibacter sp. EGI 63066]MCX2681324.1 tetratricopeptide repeat protein [Galbibacter sp. EGI 63066]
MALIAETMKLNLIFCILILFFINNPVQAQQDSNKAESTPLTFAQQEVIHSKILNEDRTINIFLPESFHEKSIQHTYPVLLLLEDEFFLMTSGVTKHLSSVERMPETIVVSLIDGPKVPKLYTNGSDFWPKDWKQLPFGGNPDPFTKHLKEELFPYLKNNFRANDFKIVMGLSATSIYTLHAFAKEPYLFDAHIAIASGDILGMGYSEGESLIDVIVKDFENNQKKTGWLYVTSADSDGNGNSPMIKTNLEELEKRLSPYRSDDFQFISKIFLDEGHYDVALPALEEALGIIFPKEKWFANYRELIKEPGNAMENIDNYFKELSTVYGFEILPKTERWNSGNSLSKISSYLLNQGKTTEAIQVIERWVKYSPKSILALNKLIEVYDSNSDFDKALSILEKAYEMSLELGIEESNEYLVKINQTKEKIGKGKN